VENNHIEKRMIVVRTLIHFATSYSFESGLFAVLVIKGGKSEMEIRKRQNA